MGIKFIEQPNEKDCGPTCLAILSKYHGKNTSIAKIRNYAGTDLYGTNISGMIHAGEKIGFDIEGYKVLDFNDLKSLSFPFIAHIVNDKGLEHFIVIEKIKKNKIFIVDPEKGKHSKVKEEFITQWTNVILTVKKNNTFTTNNTSPSVSKLFYNLLKKNLNFIIIIFICSVFISLVSIIGAYYFRFLVDTILPSKILENLHNLSIGILILYICFFLASYLRYYLVLCMGLKINKQLMLDYYYHILRLPKNFFETRKEGEILSRFRDTEYIREAFSSVTVTLIMDSLMVFVGAFLLFVQSRTLFFVLLLILPVYIVLIGYFRRPFEKYNRKEMEINSELSSKFIEGIRGIDIIKSNKSENYYYNRVKKTLNNLLSKVYVIGTYTNIQLSIKDFINLFTVLIILWIGATKVIANEMSLGELLTFNALVLYFLNPLERLIQAQPIIQSAIVATRRVVEILDLNKESKKGVCNNLEKIKKVAFKSVSFNYGHRGYTLKNIDFNFDFGESVALVGKSGSGKSTVAKLLLKYYSPKQGEIQINSNNLNDISSSTIRAKIGYVPQSSFLFYGTVIENLKIASSECIEIEKIINACKIAEAHQFIMDLPQGYDTVIENNGNNLSGGQKQRLAIARAIIKNPDLLILDEPTSSLDLNTSKIIMENLADLKCTKLVITHDLKLIKNFEKIITLFNGSILEVGTHENLVNNRSLYNKLWKIQNN